MLINHDRRAKNKDIDIITAQKYTTLLVLFLNKLMVEKIIANRKHTTWIKRLGVFMYSGTMPSLKIVSLIRESVPSNISKIEPIIIKTNGVIDI